jgi:GDP-L-fucose synthase
MKEEYLLTGDLEPTNEPYAVAKISGIKMCQAYNRQYGTQYLCIMPTNLYGPNDNFDLETSHVLPALIRKFHLAKLAHNRDWEGIRKDEEKFGMIPEDVKQSIGFNPSFSRNQKSPDGFKPKLLLWGSGNPRRELLHVDDLANGCLLLSRLNEKDLHEFFDTGQTPLINIGYGKDQTIKKIASIVSEVVGYKGDVYYDQSKPDGTPQKKLDISKIKSRGWKPNIDLKTGIIRVYEWYLKGETI